MWKTRLMVPLLASVQQSFPNVACRSSEYNNTIGKVADVHRSAGLRTVRRVAWGCRYCASHTDSGWCASLELQCYYQVWSIIFPDVQVWECWSPTEQDGTMNDSRLNCLADRSLTKLLIAIVSMHIRGLVGQPTLCLSSFSHTCSFRSRSHTSALHRTR